MEKLIKFTQDGTNFVTFSINHIILIESQSDFITNIHYQGGSSATIFHKQDSGIVEFLQQQILSAQTTSWDNPVITVRRSPESDSGLDVSIAFDQN